MSLESALPGAPRTGRWAKVRAVVVVHQKLVREARLAVRTWQAQYPDVPVVVCVVDRTGPAAPWGESVVQLDLREVDLGDRHEWARLAMALTPDELVRHVRPAVLRHVGAHNRVVSLPCDAEILGPVDSLLSAADDVVVLVPHRWSTVPHDGRHPDTADLLTLGRFDQELASFGPRSAALDWWMQQMVRDPHVPTDRLRPALVPWLDHLPAALAVRIESDPALNVSYLNADESHRLDRPCLVRWTGFDPQRPWVFSSRTGGWPRVLLSEHLKLGAMARRRARDVTELGDAEPGGFDRLPAGVRIDPEMRLAYREGLRLAEGLRPLAPGRRQGSALAAAEPPNPFSHASDHTRFLDWLSTPPAPDNLTNRYVRAAWALRPYLQARYPNPEDRKVREWAELHGRTEGLWPRLLASPSSAAALTTSTALARTAESSIIEPSAETSTVVRPRGINVFGYLRAEMGMGEAARLVLRSAQASGEAIAAVDYSATTHRRRAVEVAIDQTDGDQTDGDQTDGHFAGIDPSAERAPFDVNVVVVNADAFPGFVASRPRDFATARTTIGVWFWEVSQFPSRLHPAFEHVDEIWVASHHVAAAVSAATDIPVYVMPLGTTDPGPRREPADLQHLGIGPDRFVFGFVFDFASVGDRKNPWGAVDAFKEAFEKPGNDAAAPALVIKAISGEFHPLDRERLLMAIEDRPDIVVVDGFTSRNELQALMSRYNAYISLHRSEGWGLTLAETMALGLPVIATAYSGNVEFMDETVAWMIPFEMVDIAPSTPVYAECGQWAEPDRTVAATAMREVFEGGPGVAARAQRGQQRIRSMASGIEGAEFIRARMTAIRAGAQSIAPKRGLAEEAPDNRELATIGDVMPLPLPDFQSEPDPAPAVEEAPFPAADLAPPNQPSRDRHPGLGPVLIPPPPYREPTPVRTGFKAKAASRIVATVEPDVAELRVQQLHYATHLVEQLQLTRFAVNDIEQRAGDDQAVLTQALVGLSAHVRELQRAHDVLTASHQALQSDVVRLERQAAGIDDIVRDLASLETRVAELAALNTDTKRQANAFMTTNERYFPEAT